MSSLSSTGLVSIIVASYNHAEFLVQRMDSLINQTYLNIEIIVIEDCSTDNSVEILQKYVSHPKVRLIIREKNSGWVVVSNQGVKESSGEYILFANCDDSCAPNMIKRLVEGLVKNPTAAVSYCRSLMINEDGEILGDDFSIRERAFRKMCSNDVLIDKNQMNRFLLHSCVIPNLSAALIRKDCFLSIGGLASEYKVCSDWDLFFRISALHDVVYISEPLNEFRQHNTTIRSNTKDRIIYEEFFRLLLERIKLINLTFIERAQYRTRVMYLWASHILRPPFSGALNFQYHLGSVLKHDCYAIAYLPIAFITRLLIMIIKLPQFFLKE